MIRKVPGIQQYCLEYRPYDQRSMRGFKQAFGRFVGAQQKTDG